MINQITKDVENYLAETDLRIHSPGVAANLLGISERHMAHKLSQAGTTYSALLSSERAKRAYQAVSENPKVSTNDLLDLVGYEDTQTLYRAFEKWFGLRLKEFRQLAAVRESVEV